MSPSIRLVGLAIICWILFVTKVHRWEQADGGGGVISTFSSVMGLLRGSSFWRSTDKDVRRMQSLKRRLLPSQPKNSAQLAQCYREWNTLDESELASLAHDAASLDDVSHHAWGARYLGSRTASVHNKTQDNQTWNPLRGRSLKWSTHTGGENYNFVLEQTGHVSQEYIEPTRQEMDQLSKEIDELALQTQKLSEQHSKQTPNDGVQDASKMQQFQAQLGDKPDRQRLLTGNYASWQFFDRNSLAKPKNMKLNKVSRVNYAFFQTDDQGYIYGTDSWTDPNVLFGEYDFSLTRDKLPEACKDGLGRDDGTPKYDGYGNLVLPEDESSASNFGGRHERDLYDLERDLQNLFNDDGSCRYFEQCHRNFPGSRSCATHNYKNGLIYRSHVSGAEIYPSIGGWTLSGNFPAVSADPKKRQRFAQECVGLIEDYGFDGIEIDWEYPGYEPHNGSPADRENFIYLLKEVRGALNDYQRRTGDSPINGGTFGLSVALPCGASNIANIHIEKVAKLVDVMNLMTFDFHSASEPVTGANSPLFDQEWDEEPGNSVDGCVQNYYSGGAGKYSQKISIGVPFYGKTYPFATELNGFHSNTNGRGGGMSDQVNWPKDLGSPVYYNIVDKLSKGNMVIRRHEPTKTSYAYFNDGSGLVSYDDPQSVCDKAGYVHDNLLGGLFVWEMSGDLLENLNTPLMDSINRKLEETNFDCRLIAPSEDGKTVELPPPAPKGPFQIEQPKGTDRLVSIKDATMEFLDRVEKGELSFGVVGKGAFTRTAFMHRRYDGSTFPSYVYRFAHFVEALESMASEGVDGDLFYLGPNQLVGESASSRRRELQGIPARLVPGEALEGSMVYGLVNIALFLSHAHAESILHDTCDEVNVQFLPNSDFDGMGLDDGEDASRFPISNACGQDGRSYQDELCTRPEDSRYDCTAQLNVDEFESMEASAVSRGIWAGAPRGFYCGPKNVYGTTGFWDAIAGQELDTNPTANQGGRTDVEGCCFWGRGSLKIKGTCTLGKLNYHLGKNKADRDGRENAKYPDVNFCLDPGQICAGVHSIPLRWISGLYHWVDNVQKYDRDGFNFQKELIEYVNNNLASEFFYEAVTNIHVHGCHNTTVCDSSGRSVRDEATRRRIFEKILTLFGLQFGSFAKPEPPFTGFPGQLAPTPAPTVVPELNITSVAPTKAPIEVIFNEEVPINVFLTGVPRDQNMSNSELITFESLMFDLMGPRLATVDVETLQVITTSQNPSPESAPESVFEGVIVGGGEEIGILQVVINVTISYTEKPEVVRDWSIYLKAWVESFGTTMVEVFTSPKHPQHPDTTSKFWDRLKKVSATNVEPKDYSPTGTPTSSPTYWIVDPAPASNTYIIVGSVSAVVLVICVFCACFCIKLRNFRQIQANIKLKKSMVHGDDEEALLQPERSRQVGFMPMPISMQANDEDIESESSASSSDDSSSGSSDDSSDSSSGDSSDSSSEEENDTFVSEAESTSQTISTGVFTNDDLSKDVPSTPQSALGPMDSHSVFDDEEESAYLSGIASEPSASRASQSTRSRDGREEFDEIVEHVLANDPSFRQVALDSRDLEGNHHSCEDLWNALANNSYVDRLSLRDTGFNDDDAAALSLALADNTAITHIWLGYNDITTEGAEYIISTVERNENIVYIELEGNDIDGNLEDDLISILGPREEEYDRRSSASSQASSALHLERVGEAKRMSRARGPDLNSLMNQVRDDDPNLLDLNLSKMNIGSREDALSLFEALASNTHLRSVNLSRNNIDDDCVSSISIALIENKSIVRLNLSINDINSEGAEYLIGALDTNHTIREIDLRGNSIDHEILQELDEILKERRGDDPSLVPSIISLDLNRIMAGLATNDDDLIEVRLDGVDMEAAELEALVEALGCNTSVMSLSLNNTKFDDTLMATLSLSLVDNTKLENLSLRNNDITSEGIEYLLGTLHTNETLAYVDVKGNQIDDYHMDELQALLSPRQSSDHVDLAGIVERARANDATLTEVRIHNADLSTSDEIDALFEALASNSTIRKLSLNGCNLQDTQISILSLSLVENTSISHVLLRDNAISDEGCEYLLGTLDTNTTVSFVDMDGNLVADDLMGELEILNEERGGVPSVATDHSGSRSGASQSIGESAYSSVASLSQGTRSLSRSAATRSRGGFSRSTRSRDGRSSARSRATSRSGATGYSSAAASSRAGSSRATSQSSRSGYSTQSGVSARSWASRSGASNLSGAAGSQGISYSSRRSVSTQSRGDMSYASGSRASQSQGRRGDMSYASGSRASRSQGRRGDMSYASGSRASQSQGERSNMSYASGSRASQSQGGSAYSVSTRSHSSFARSAASHSQGTGDDYSAKLSVSTRSAGHSVSSQSSYGEAQSRATDDSSRSASQAYSNDYDSANPIQEISKQFQSAPKEQDAEESQCEGSTMSLLDEVRLNEPDLDEVELDGRDIPKDDALELFRDLANNTHVTFLSMAGCQLDNECVAALADSLKVNKTLVEINLEENNITSNAAQSLIKVLKEENNTLQYLELKDNKVRLGLLTQIEKLLEPRRSE